MPADDFAAEDILYSGEMVDHTPLQDFYRGKTIFLTGGTGFLGKLLIEKLLYTCPDIRKIYFLVRNKKGKKVSDRIEELCNDTIFSRIKRDIGPIEKYMNGIAGDCEEPNLGISEVDKELLEKEVEVVFHVAATVRFDEELNKALNINVRATKYIVDLMKNMANLKAAVHVSTAYSNCNRNMIGETFYPSGIPAAEALALKGDIKADESFLRTWPNTYTFTKCIAEDVVHKYAKGLPVAIFRPSIITGTTADGPLTGWIDNQYGPTGVIIGVGVGLIRTLEIDMEKVADMVPGDMCANAMIAAAWDVSSRESDEIPILNFVSSTRNSITWGRFIEDTLSYGTTIPVSKGIWCMSFSPTKVHWYYLLLRFFLHTLPAFIVDIFLIIAGNKLRMKRVYRTLHKFSTVLTFFTRNQWTFAESNVVDLWSRLSDRDKKMLPFDISQLYWPTYLRDVCDGARVYLVGEDLNTLPKARNKYKRFVIIHNTIKIIFASILIWISYSVIFGILTYMDIRFTDSIKSMDPHISNLN